MRATWPKRPGVFQPRGGISRAFRHPFKGIKAVERLSAELLLSRLAIAAAEVAFAAEGAIVTTSPTRERNFAQLRQRGARQAKVPGGARLALGLCRFILVSARWAEDGAGAFFIAAA